MKRGSTEKHDETKESEYLHFNKQNYLRSINSLNTIDQTYLITLWGG